MSSTSQTHYNWCVSAIAHFQQSKIKLSFYIYMHTQILICICKYILSCESNIFSIQCYIELLMTITVLYLFILYLKFLNIVDLFASFEFWFEMVLLCVVCHYSSKSLDSTKLHTQKNISL